MEKLIFHTAIYSRKPTKEEIEAGMKKNRRINICVPIKDVFLGVGYCCEAILKKSIKGEDGLRYYFSCINIVERYKL